MKKNELKQIIKPLVKECITEVLIEEGLLSNIVSEVAKGMSQTAPLRESQSTPIRESTSPSDEEIRKMRRAREQVNARKRQDLMDAIGRDAYNGVNLFEGTTALTETEASTPKAGSVDLGNPGDAGVDISSLVGGASRMWDAMK